jgi:hypothetical protein
LVGEDGASLFTGQGLIPGTTRASTGSAKCDAYLWMKIHYLDAGRCDAAYGAYYADQYWLRARRRAPLNHHCLTNHDFFVARRGFFFDLGVWEDEPPIDDPSQRPGLDRRTLLELLHSAYLQGGRERMIHIGGFVPWAYKYTTHVGAGGRHAPVPTEWEYAKLISAYNGFMDADAIGHGAMANASFFAHFPLRDRYPQPWVTDEQLQARGYLAPSGELSLGNRQLLVFYVGDYDCAAWLYQRAPDIWDDPARGEVPLMWCISPMLDRRAPMAMHYLRASATPNDYFAASDNGAGYLNPGMLQEPRPISGLPSGLDAWARHNRSYYDRWGLCITGFVIDGHAPPLNRAGLDCYASFSQGGIVPTRGPRELLHEGMPVLRFGPDVNDGNPTTAARKIAAYAARHRAEGGPPFLWVRNILKRPSWYVQVVAALRASHPEIELVDGPTVFELYKRHLQQ